MKHISQKGLWYKSIELQFIRQNYIDNMQNFARTTKFESSSFQ